MNDQQADFELILINIPLKFSNGDIREAISDGVAAAWNCNCGTMLIGRSYSNLTDACFTRCPQCSTTYKVTRHNNTNLLEVKEQPAT